MHILSEEKLASFLKCFQKAEEEMQHVKSQNSLDLNQKEEKLKAYIPN